MMRALFIVSLVIVIGQGSLPAQTPKTEAKLKVMLAKNPYNGSREQAELSAGPDALERGGLADVLTRLGCEFGSRSARLTGEEEKQYGAWNRMGLANGHLSRIVTESLKEGRFPLGLLANCNSLMGMLAGLQHSGPGTRPLKIGLMWIDAHADFNTPETTLSGMLGGMPVAVSTGLCLSRFRIQSGLDPALPFAYVVMVGVRDVDPLEQELVDRYRLERVAARDILPPFQKLHEQMKRLVDLTDLVYVHIDMDVLDPAEVPGHSLNVAGGPSSKALAGALEAVFSYRQAAALGIASYPGERDQGKISLKAAYALVEGALRGTKSAKSGSDRGMSRNLNR